MRVKYKQPHNFLTYSESDIMLLLHTIISIVQLLRCRGFYERKGFGCGNSGWGKLGVVPLYGCCLIWLIVGLAPPSPGDVLDENGFAIAVNKTFVINMGKNNIC